MVATTRESKTTLTAEDKTGSAFASMQKNVGDATARFERMQAAIVGLATGGAVGAFALMVKGAMDAMAAMKDLAQDAGISVEQLSRFEEPARLAGMTLGDVSSAMQKLSKTLIEAKDPTSNAAQALHAFGINAVKLKGLSLDQTFELLARESDKYAGSAEKNAALMELTGKTGAQLQKLFAEIAEKQKLVSSVTNEQAEAADRLQDSMVKLQMKTEGMTRAGTSTLLPYLQNVLDAFVKLKGQQGETTGFFDAVGRVIATVAGMAGTLWLTIKQLGEGLALQAALMKNIFNSGARAELIEAGIESTKRYALGVSDLWANLYKAADAQDKVVSGAKQTAQYAPAAAAATAKQVAEYDNFVTSLNAKIAGSEEELIIGRKLFESEKMLKDIRNGVYDKKFNEAQLIRIELMTESWVATQKLTDETKEAIKASIEFEKTVKALGEAYRKSVAGATDWVNAMEFENTLLGKTRLQREVAIKLRDLENRGIRAGSEAYEELAPRIIAAAEAHAALEESMGFWDGVSTSAGNFFSDLVLNGKSAFDSLKQSLKSLAADLIAFFAKKWVLQMVAGGAGTFGATAASAASSALGGMGNSAIGSALGGAGGSVLGSAANILGGAFGAGSIFGTAGAYGAALGTTSIAAGSQAALLAAQTGVFGASGLAATGAAAGGTAGSVVGGASAGLGAVPVVGWIALAALAAYAIFAQKAGGPKTSGTGGSLVDASGAVSNSPMSDVRRFYYANDKSQDSVFQKISDATATSFAELLKKFGGKGAGSFEFFQSGDSDPQGKAMNRLATQVFGPNGAKIFEQKNENLARDGSQNAAEMQLQAQRALIAALQASNLPGEMGKLFAGVAASTLTDADYQALIARATDLAGVLEYLGTTTLPGFTLDVVKAMSATGETLGQTTSRIANQWAALNDVFKTEPERMDEANAAIKAAFDSINVGVPANAEAFKALIGTIDLSTESGRTLFNTLSMVAPAFKTVSDAAIAATNDLNAAIGARNPEFARTATLGSRNDIAQQFADASGQTFNEALLARMALNPETFSGLSTAAMGLLTKFLGLQTTLEGFDSKVTKIVTAIPAIPGIESQRTFSRGLGLSDATPAITDTSGIAAERLRLQEQLNALTDTAAQALTRQRDALDASNRALFDQIQAATRANTIAAERRTLEEQLLSLTETEVEAIARKRNALDASNRAVFDQIQAQQALKAATQAAAQATAEAARIEADLVKQRAGISGQITDLQNPAGAIARQRALELSGITDVALRALTMRLWALQDAATAAAAASQAAAAAAQLEADLVKQRAGILGQIADLQNPEGATARQRAEALAAITDTALRALTQQLWGLQDAAAAAAREAELVKQRAGILGQIADLQNPAGATTRQRAEALAAITDTALRALTQQLWGLQDAAAAAAAAAGKLEQVRQQGYGLQSQLLQLQGNTAELRARELALLDPANRAIQQQIWALQDQQAAAALAAQASQAASSAAAQAAADQMRAADQIRSAWQSATDSIMGEVARIRGLMLSSKQSAEAALSAFTIAVAKAQSGDLDAAGQLAGLSRNALDAGSANARSALDERRLQASLLGSLETTAGIIGDQRGVTVTSDPALLKEIQDLKAAMVRMQADAAATAAASKKTADLLLRVTRDGNSLLTTAA